MKILLFGALAFAFALSGSPALAKGCLKSAAVGGAGGHMVGKGHSTARAAAERDRPPSFHQEAEGALR